MRRILRITEMSSSGQGFDGPNLPEAVKQGVAKNYLKAVIKKAEKLTKGSNVSHEVVANDGKKKMELACDAQGNPTPKAKD